MQTPNNDLIARQVSAGLSVDETAQYLGSTDKILLKHQSECVEAMLDKKYNVVVIGKGRRTGITWAAAGGKTIKAAQSRKAGGSNVYYIGPSLDMAREFISTCASWAKALNHSLRGQGIKEEIFDDESEKGIKAFRIDFHSGFSIIALSSAPRSVRGRQGDFVIDEAAFHDDLPALLKATLAMLIWGGHVTLISTHNGADNPFNELIEYIKEGRLDYKHLHIPFMYAVRCGLYKRICQIKGTPWSVKAEKEWVDKIYKDYGDDAEEELDAIPGKSGGGYIKIADVMACQDADIPVIRYAQKDSFKFKEENKRKKIINEWLEENLLLHLNNLGGGKFVFGMDIARTSDLTVIWPLCELSNTNYYTPFVVELRNMPYSAQQQILFYIIDHFSHFCGGAIDATGGGKETAERVAQRYGEDLIKEVTFSKAAYKEIMPPYKRRLEDRTILIPKDRDVRDDHKLVIKDADGIPKIAKIRTGQKTNKRHGDAAVAASLAVHALDNAAVSFEFSASYGRDSEGLDNEFSSPFDRGY